MVLVLVFDAVFNPLSLVVSLSFLPKVLKKPPLLDLSDSVGDNVLEDLETLLTFFSGLLGLLVEAAVVVTVGVVVVVVGVVLSTLATLTIDLEDFGTGSGTSVDVPLSISRKTDVALRAVISAASSLSFVLSVAFALVSYFVLATSSSSFWETLLKDAFLSICVLAFRTKRSMISPFFHEVPDLQ